MHGSMNVKSGFVYFQYVVYVRSEVEGELAAVADGNDRQQWGRAYTSGI